MGSELMSVIGWIAGFCFAVLIIIAVSEAFAWLLRAAIMATSCGLRSIRMGMHYLLRWLLSQLRKGVSVVINKIKQSCLAWWSAFYQASMQQINLYWFYLIKGSKDFNSFEDFKNDWNEFKQDQDNSQSGPKAFQEQASSAYSQALNVLGLADQPHFTLADLKDQLRKMRAIVHPDKGFPNRVFFQQLNDAFAIVKHERNWV